MLHTASNDVSFLMCHPPKDVLPAFPYTVSIDAETGDIKLWKQLFYLTCCRALCLCPLLSHLVSPVLIMPLNSGVLVHVGTLKMTSFSKIAKVKGLKF